METDHWTVDDVLAQDFSTLKLDFGRCIDLALYPDRTAFMHCFRADKSPEMRDGKPLVLSGTFAKMINISI